jgi:hypothetical protein
MGTGRGILLRIFGTPISITPLLVIVRAATAALMTLALSYPVHAQFWGDSWGGRQQQRQQSYNPFGGGFWDNRQWESPRYPRERRQTFIDYMREWEHSAAIRIPISYLVRLYPRPLENGNPDLIESTVRLCSGEYGEPALFEEFPAAIFTRDDTAEGDSSA